MEAKAVHPHFQAQQHSSQALASPLQQPPGTGTVHVEVSIGIVYGCRGGLSGLILQVGKMSDKTAPGS